MSARNVSSARFVGGGDVLMATPEGWVSMGRLVDGSTVADLLTDDEQAAADRWSTIDLTAAMTVTFQAEPTAMLPVIPEVREALAYTTGDDAHAVIRAIAQGARAAGYGVLILNDLDDIADAIPRPREEPR